jgi:hypothetical protein
MVMIEELKPNQIFVFGSNLEGNHAAGSAKQANQSFGAVYGIGVGLQGQSYAIPTMSGFNTMQYYCMQFLDFAVHYPEYEFLLTPVGTGIAGYEIKDIEPLFETLPSNVTKVGW